MDLSWCPVCDQQTFALENLYCSEACRRKDELNPSCPPTGTSSISESFYEFPRCASQKPHQSPYNTPTCSPKTTPFNSPILCPQTSSSSTTNSIYFYNDYYCAISSVPGLEEETSHKLSSSPSEFLQLSRMPLKSRALAPMIFFACKEAVLSSSIRKKRSFPVNGVSAQHYL